MVDDSVLLKVGWINERIRLNGNAGKIVTIVQYYKFLRTTLFSNCTGFSLERNLVVLQRMGLQKSLLRVIRYLTLHPTAFNHSIYNTGIAKSGRLDEVSHKSCQSLSKYAFLFQKTYDSSQYFK